MRRKTTYSIVNIWNQSRPSSCCCSVTVEIIGRNMPYTAVEQCTYFNRLTQIHTAQNPCLVNRCLPHNCACSRICTTSRTHTAIVRAESSTVMKTLLIRSRAKRLHTYKLPIESIECVVHDHYRGLLGFSERTIISITPQPPPLSSSSLSSSSRSHNMFISAM